MALSGRVIGDYWVGREIGSGSFSVIWEARHHFFILRRINHQQHHPFARHDRGYTSKDQSPQLKKAMFLPLLCY
ncbi:hypothetical protein Bca4012_081801 [Brassica carinata]|uniref:Uncharacterized protein n=1 Tax=Brassica carinata TaxID=52824 RepID=A0A8X8ANW5_BRACI|nr:hypothetical protein Bca52824_029027 [Brassica carinata]